MMTSLLACKQFRGFKFQVIKPTLRSSNGQVIRFYAKRVPRGLQKEPRTIGVAGTLFLVMLILSYISFNHKFSSDCSNYYFLPWSLAIQQTQLEN